MCSKTERELTSVGKADFEVGYFLQHSTEDHGTHGGRRFRWHSCRNNAKLSKNHHQEGRTFCNNKGQVRSRRTHPQAKEASTSACVRPSACPTGARKWPCPAQLLSATPSKTRYTTAKARPVPLHRSVPLNVVCACDSVVTVVTLTLNTDSNSGAFRFHSLMCEPI